MLSGGHIGHQVWESSVVADFGKLAWECPLMVDFGNLALECPLVANYGNLAWECPPGCQSWSNFLRDPPGGRFEQLVLGVPQVANLGKSA